MSSICAISTVTSSAWWRAASSVAASAARWGDLSGQRVLGIGYATPYLGLFRAEAERCLAFMPAHQGVVKWPTTRPALAALVDEYEMPLPDNAVDRVLLIHSLEVSHDAAALLREAWRVLAAGGRLMAVVPNRRGLWARMDTTPFGHGRPYSRSQITALLRETWFTPTGWDEALYVPPIPRKWFLRTAGAWERTGASPLGAVCRRAHRRGDQAGLSRHSRARQAAAVAGARAGAGAVARRRKTKPPEFSGGFFLILFAGLWRWLVSTAALVHRRLLALLWLAALEIRARSAMAAAAVPAVTVVPRSPYWPLPFCWPPWFWSGFCCGAATGDERRQTVQVAPVRSALLRLRLRLVLLILRPRLMLLMMLRLLVLMLARLLLMLRLLLVLLRLLLVSGCCCCCGLYGSFCPFGPNSSSSPSSKLSSPPPCGMPCCCGC